MTSEAIKKLLERPPSAVVSGLIEWKRAHRELCLQDFRIYIKLFEEAFSVASLAVETLKFVPKKGWPLHRGVQYLFLPGILETLLRAFDDYVEGFYAEAAILNRSAFNGLVRIIYCSCYPENTGATFTHKPPVGAKFNMTRFLEQDLKLDWGALWRLGSAATHAKSDRVLLRLCAIRRGEQKVAEFSLQYDRMACSGPANKSSFPAWTFLRLLFLLFPELMAVPKMPEEEKDKLRLAEVALKDLLLGLPNAFGRYVADVEKIEKIVTAAERGEDWPSSAALSSA